MAIDLAAPATFEKARKLIEERFGRLDVLINNAAIGEPEDFQRTAENVSIETLRRTFETNFFGLVDLTQRLLPLLQRSEHPRIVNQSSILASLTEHSDPNSVIADVHALAYDASKTAGPASMFAKIPRLLHQALGSSRQRQDGYESMGDLSVGRRANCFVTLTIPGVSKRRLL
jgi:NAD(P)-dependent dehydrogenase (short-subunit alcohol dehydrogenase family)